MSTYICKNCSQMFYTEKGLSSHMCFHSNQWPSPRGKQEQQVKGQFSAYGGSSQAWGQGLAGDVLREAWLGQGSGPRCSRGAPSSPPTVPALCVQVCGTELCRPPRQVQRPEGDGQSPPGARKPLDSMTVAPLVGPVPGPVAAANRPPGSKVGAGQPSSSPCFPHLPAELWEQPSRMAQKG